MLAYAVVWKYADEDGQVRALMGHPGAYPNSQEEAVQEGRRILSALAGYNVEPVSIVETEKDIHEDIWECEEVYIGPPDNDEIFYDVSGMGRWQHMAWWPR